MKRFIFSMLLICSLFIFSSCEKEVLYTTATVELSFDTSAPTGIVVESGEYVFKNISTSEETTLDINSGSLSVVEGIYNITFLGSGYYIIDGTDYHNPVTLQGSKESVTITGDNLSVDMSLIVTEPNLEGDFVFSELFLTGTYKPTGTVYNGDQYVVIHNNSNKVQYADKLIFFESKFATNTKYDYTPDVMSEAVAVHAMMIVPGDGTTYPIEPGESFIIADNAMNHLEANTNSTDLSNALFEWHSDLSTIDVDNPSVTNLENVYLSSGTFWMANKQGTRAYVIGRLPEDVTTESFLADYKYDYSYAIGSYTMNASTYKFPNDWILDGVNLSPTSAFVWRVMDDTVDLGYASFGANTTTSENAGMAVVRKVDETNTAAEGRTILVDNNNSTSDFETVGATLIN